MSLGRLVCEPGADADDVVVRVNELLVPLFLRFRPVGLAPQICEMTGDAVWELVAVPQPDQVDLPLPPSGGRHPNADLHDTLDAESRTVQQQSHPTVYRWTPRPDVTAHDLARVQAMLGLRLVQQPGGADVAALLGPDLLRHFTVE